MNMIQTRANIYNNTEDSHINNMKSVSVASDKMVIPIDTKGKEKTLYYERFQKENIDFIQTLLRLKLNNPNNYNDTDTDTRAYTNVNTKDPKPREEINPFTNKRLLLLDQYPKPYQPHISSSSKPKRTKSRSLIRENDIISVSPKESSDRQKFLLSPFLKQDIQRQSNQDKLTQMFIGSSSNHKPSIIPRYAQNIKRTNSSSAINQPLMSTSTSTSTTHHNNYNNHNNKKNDKSSSLRNNKNRLSISTTLTTRTSSCIANNNNCKHDRRERGGVVKNRKKNKCIGINIIYNKSKEHNSGLSRYSNNALGLSEPNVNSKPTMVIYNNIIEHQRQTIPLAEIDLCSEDKADHNHNPNNNEEYDNNVIITKQISTNQSKRDQCHTKKSANKSYNDIKPQKHSLSFIDKKPPSSQAIIDTNNANNNNNKDKKNKSKDNITKTSIYTFQRRSKKKQDINA